MQKIIVFTDIHFVPEGETIIGLDPAARFAQGLAHAQKHHPDAARIVITGDLTHHGTEPEYRRLQAALADVQIPVSLMLGNHDRRRPFRSVFTDAPQTPEGFVQDSIDLDDTRLVLLDTLNEESDDTHSGLLCNDRLDWMEAAIAGAQGHRVILFLHHPPILTGFGGMDWIGLKSRRQLAARLEGHDSVHQIVAGHIHRTIQGGFATGAGNRIPTAIFKSPCHQMPMALGFQDPSLSVDEPGAYGLLLLGPDGIVVHTEDFTLPPADRVCYDTDSG
ncbi:phosphodiesterase [Roseovarius sp.]|uniref:phosphodiesterase n=1 Tax=Roseovarius sp. TaxID=1486281 RepID=UPI003D1452AA